MKVNYDATDFYDGVRCILGENLLIIFFSVQFWDWKIKRNKENDGIGERDGGGKMRADEMKGMKRWGCKKKRGGKRNWERAVEINILRESHQGTTLTHTILYSVLQIYSLKKQNFLWTTRLQECYETYEHITKVGKGSWHLPP